LVHPSHKRRLKGDLGSGDEILGEQAFTPAGALRAECRGRQKRRGSVYCIVEGSERGVALLARGIERVFALDAGQLRDLRRNLAATRGGP
jgi:hypothetical protein